VTRTFGSSHTKLIDISCPDGRISYRANTPEKVDIDMKEKYRRPAQETNNIREMQVEIVPIREGGRKVRANTRYLTLA
jgi:hypothetical protein